MLVSFLLLALGFILLVSGAGKLIEASSSLARRLNIPEIVIGLTIVSLGTSSPELVVNIVASIKNESDMVLGNVLGSNIFNVLIVLGVTSITGTLTVKRNTTWLEIPLSLMGALMVLIIASDKLLDHQSVNIIGRIDGIVLVCLAIIFLVYNLELAKKENKEVEIQGKQQRIVIAIFWLLVGLAGLINATAISREFGIPERIIAITVIAVGTSLPELVTSLMAVRKGKVDLAIGNVVGSNIINIFFILGVSSIITSVPVPENTFLDIYLNIFAAVLLFFFLLLSRKRQLLKWVGILFIIIYCLYILSLLFPDKLKV